MAHKSRYNPSPFGTYRAFMRVRNKTQKEKIEILLMRSNENYVLACEYQEKYMGSLDEIAELKTRLRESEESYKTETTAFHNLMTYKIEAQLKAERSK